MDNVIELEPLPDATQATRKRGRPKRSGDDAAKEREADVQKVKDILHDLRKNELTGSIEYTDPTGKTIILQGNDLDLMTTKLACEHGVFIPETRIKSAIQYAAQKNQYCLSVATLTTAGTCCRTLMDKTKYPWQSSRYCNTAMQRMMIGAVARAYNPGCSMSWLLILVGAQGAGSHSSAVALYLMHCSQRLLLLLRH